MKKLFNICIAAWAVVAISSCDNDDNVDEMPPVVEIATGPDQLVYGLSENNELIVFNSKSPNSFTSKTAISGVASGEKLLSIDFRPATGELYAVSNASKFYIINTSNASARVVSTTPFVPAISGSVASIDFNPTVDRIRLVSSNGQNLRLNPETGAIAAVDTNINGGSMPSITGIAYTNSISGASSTTLFDLDASTGKLYKQDPPNNGMLVEVGSLGITFSGQAAFDINHDNSIALAAVTTDSKNQLYKIDITNGKATNIGSLSQKIIDIAIPTNPVAYAIDNDNALQIFNPGNLSVMPIKKAISGLQANENILGIDFRPVNGQLYALGSTSRLYTINLGTGAATVLGGQLSTLLVGTEFGFDFNPTVDRIRVVSNLGQNLRLNPIDASVSAVDGMINPGMPMLSSAAYTNNFAGATTTSLFVIDHNTDKLYLQNPPNNGTLVEVGSLGVDITNSNGFDIGSTSQKAYLVATSGTETKLYNVNTSTGTITAVGVYPNAVRGFSVGLGF
jgi:hypothetical protein